MISAARMRGRTHDRCDDRILHRRFGPWRLAALADGAGSKPRGGTGASLALRSLARSLPPLLELLGEDRTEDLLLSQLEALGALLIDEIQSTVDRHRADTAPRGDYAATLLFALHHTGGFWLLGHLGDGVIGGIDRSWRPRLLSGPENGEFANETFFCTDRDAAERLRLSLHRDLGSVLLMSDGPATLFYRRTDGSVSPALRSLAIWQRKLGAQRLSGILRNNLRRHALPRTEDDCSLILLQPRRPLLPVPLGESNPKPHKETA